MNKFKIDIDILENLEVGLDAIAYTSDPAIEILGLAFNKDKPSKMIFKQNREYFKDETKMRISGPLMLVKDIYRYNDEDDEYEIIFDYDSNQALTNQLKKKLTSINKEYLFNDEHFEDKPIKAYILNIMFMESEIEIKYIKEKYNYDLQLGDVWIDTQVEDIKTYKYLVDNNKIGFSVEGIFKLNEVIKSELNKMKKILEKFNLTEKEFNELKVLFKSEKEEEKEKEDLEDEKKKEDESLEDEKKKEDESLEDEKKKEEDLEDEDKDKEDLEDEEKKKEDLEDEDKDEDIYQSQIDELTELIGELQARLNELEKSDSEEKKEEFTKKSEFSLKGIMSK